MKLAVFCADVGSIPKGNFGWFGQAESECSGNTPESLANSVNEALRSGFHVSLGFECPLFVPLPENQYQLTSARKGEGSRPWSAGAGCGALATGLTEVAWFLRELRRLQPNAHAHIDWNEFIVDNPSLFIWEAFISGGAKGTSHIDDARLGVLAFQKASNQQTPISIVECPISYSLIGAALLRTEWSTNLELLKTPCLVISAQVA